MTTNETNEQIPLTEAVPPAPSPEFPKRGAEIVSLLPIQPGGTGQLILKMAGTSADLLGIELEAGAEAQRIRGGGKLDLSLQDDTLTLDEVVQKQSPPARLRGFVTLIVKNISETAQSFKAILWIGNEKQEAAVPKVQNVGRPQQADGTQGSVKQAPRRSAAPQNVRVQKRVPAPAPRRVVVKKLAENRAGHVPAVRHVTQQDGLDLIAPRPGEQAVLLIKGHVMGLLRFLTLRVPIHPSFAPSVLKQLVLSAQREGAVATGGNEAVVLLRMDQVQNLHQIVSRKFNHLTEEPLQELIRALQKGLDRAEHPPASQEPPHLLETGT